MGQISDVLSVWRFLFNFNYSTILKIHDMKHLYILILFFFVLTAGRAQSNPEPFNLFADDYSMTEWSEEAAPGTYPTSMIFHVHSMTNAPLLEDEPDGDWLCLYNIGSRSRVIGLGEEGFSFLNTGDIQSDQSRCGNGPDDVGGYIGGAVLSLNTMLVTDIELSYELTLIAQAADTRFYDVRLQYRFDTESAWEDVPGAPVFSADGLEAGFMTEYNVELGEEFSNRELVQIRWKYYQNNVDGGGSRPQIGFDEIAVSGTRTTSIKDRIKEAKPFSFFPNPVKGEFIFFDAAVNIILYDTSGKMIKQVDNTERFFVGDLQPGVYIMRNENGMVSKFIKQ